MITKFVIYVNGHGFFRKHSKNKELDCTLQIEEAFKFNSYNDALSHMWLNITEQSYVLEMNTEG